MNYRHAFHAGNFADLAKHAALLQMLARRQGPVTVIDTHAGRGLYDLASAEARKSGEAAQGVERLMAASSVPAAFAPLVAAVRRFNPAGSVQRYPGSPCLIAEALDSNDHYLACELRPDEHAALQALMRGRGQVQTLCADGYVAAVERCPRRGSVLLLIDPPFEKADDYSRSVDTVAAARSLNSAVQALVWLPLKDLETFDAFLRDLEDAVDGPMIIAETRLRPLHDPLKMNGCALALVGADPGLLQPIEAICGWLAETLGDRGEARVRSL